MAETAAVSGARSGLVERAVTLLELVAVEPRGVGVREAARRTGIDRSAVSRILLQLDELGFVEQHAANGVYVAGPRLFGVVAALHERDDLWRAAEPLLRRLVDKYDETCYLAVRHDRELVFRGKVDCGQRIRYVIELGRPFPLASGAAGMAILTGMHDDEVRAVLAGGLEAHTEKSITDPDEYRRHVEHDRDVGYVYSPGRWVRGGAGIAAPFFDAARRCAGAITLSGPADRLELLSLPEAGGDVRAAAVALSQRLGHLEASPVPRRLPAGD